MSPLVDELLSLLESCRKNRMQIDEINVYSDALLQKHGSNPC